MKTDETLSTRELAGGTEERSGGRFDRDDDDTARERETATTSDIAADSTADMRDDTPELLPGDENDEFQRRWETIQTGVVDEPRQTVEQADELVAEVMRHLAEGFAAERERLEVQWGRGEDVSTEDLRVAL